MCLFLCYSPVTSPSAADSYFPHAARDGLALCHLSRQDTSRGVPNRSNRRARVDQESRSSPCLRLARLRHGHACCKHERRYVDTRSSMRGRATEDTLMDQRSFASSCSHSPTHWITQDALLDMIDAGMHARPGDAELTPWLLVLDCAPQHIAAEFRSIMRPHIKLCYVQRNFTGYTQPLDRAYMPAFKNSIRQEVTKHFAEFFLEVESNFERVNLDSSTSVLRQLLLSFVHTAAHHGDSPQHRTAGWRFIDWNEVEQRELLAEAKRLLETGRTVSTRHSRGASRARCRGRSQRQRARGARNGASGRQSHQRQ